MTIKENLLRIREQISKTCSLSGRNEKDVKLVAVSKFHSVTDISAAADCGQTEFGENYFQEWQKKANDISQILTGAKLQWHLIGHLQSRKARLAAGRFALIHTLDSEKLANGLQRMLEETNIVQDVLIEVNIAEEPQKSGIASKDLCQFAEKIFQCCPNLQLRGLMCMAPFSESGENARKYFSALRKLRDKLETSLGKQLPELSMGMSGDFQAAIAEGATIVRLGTAIFGPRPVKVYRY